MSRLTNASVAEADDARAFSARNAGDSARLFRAARRHSRRVRVLRIALPVIVALGISTVFFATYFNPLRMLKALPGDLAGVVISGSKIKMEAPRLAGFTRDSRAFELVAKSAAQDLLKPDLVELQDIQAKIELPDKAFLNLTARSGVYDTKKDMLTLTDEIVLTSDGYRGLLKEAVIDVRNGKVVSDKPVELSMLQGSMTAKRFEIIDSGEIARFSGGVTVTFAPGMLQGKKEAP
jgi:lipopolysaccharide export system protein LptC